MSESENIKSCSFRGYLVQFTVVLLINVPVMSYGAALGWVSGASGIQDGREEWGNGDLQLVISAALTLLFGALGVPLAAAAIAYGRKPAIIATSAGFFACWCLKLFGGWGVLAGRAVAGVAGTAAWTLAPVLAKEMCSKNIRGAAGGACVAAHNLGMLVMYVAAELRLRSRTVLWAGMTFSGVHVFLYLLMPESPSFLAANGKLKEASNALSILRGLPEPPTQELSDLPCEQPPVKHIAQLKEMWKDHGRRRALLISLVAVTGQELTGVLVILQYAERVFQLAGESETARLATGLGAAQLIGSLVSLYLVERLGRRPLVLWSALATGLSLSISTVCVWTDVSGAGAALALAVLSDSMGAEVAPYAMIADMFSHDEIATVTLVASAAGHFAAALQAVFLPVLAGTAGIHIALLTAALLTTVYFVWALICLPETRGRLLNEIFSTKEKCCDNVECSAV